MRGRTRRPPKHATTRISKISRKPLIQLETHGEIGRELSNSGCLIAAALAYALGARLHASDGSVRIFTFGTAAVALVMLAVVLEQSQTFVANRFWVALGNSSYTLYLAHLSLLVAFYFLGIRGFLASQPGGVREAGFFLYLGFCFWLTHWFYIRVEAPLYRWASSARSLPPPDRAWQSPNAK